MNSHSLHTGLCHQGQWVWVISSYRVSQQYRQFEYHHAFDWSLPFSISLPLTIESSLNNVSVSHRPEGNCLQNREYCHQGQFPNGSNNKWLRLINTTECNEGIEVECICGSHQNGSLYREYHHINNGSTIDHFQYRSIPSTNVLSLVIRIS